MAFDNYYPRRKDWRKGYRKSGRFDATCRPGGSCPYCQSGRQYRWKKRVPVEEVTVYLGCWEESGVKAGGWRVRYYYCDREECQMRRMER